MNKFWKKLKEKWRRMQTSAQFHNVLMFLLFVLVAAIFWFIVALNDNVTETFKIKLNIQDVPDSVTFINTPPADIHVTMRDKGTNILRSGIIKNPCVDINFHDYSSDGVFRLKSSDIVAELKSDLGAGVQISNVSLDSLRLLYTSDPGKRVPVKVCYDLSPASGYVISGEPRPVVKGVKIYSFGNEIDTVHSVMTQCLTKRNLSKSGRFAVNLRPIKGVKIIPDRIDVDVTVEPLVHKEIYANVEIDNLPDGESLLLFPNRVPVSFYVPMSRFNDSDIPVEVSVDYLDAKSVKGSRIPVRLGHYPPMLVNVELRTDSIEFTLVKH